MATNITSISDLAGKMFACNLLTRTSLELKCDGVVIFTVTGEDLEDTWNTIAVAGKPYDVHISFFDECTGYDEWLETHCTFEIFGLEKLDDGTVQVDTSEEIVIPINLYDSVAIYSEISGVPHKRCSECDKVVPETEGRPYKYEGERWVCDPCHDALMNE